MRDLVLRLTAAAFACLTLTGPVTAQSQPTATELRLGLVGHWSGALGYRDYKTDALFEIPVTTTITTPGDGATQVRQSLFDDGPDKPVWITTVSLDDTAAGTSTSASFRAGNTPELSTDTVTVSAFPDPTHWTLFYSRVGADDSVWRFRNQTRLTRAGD